MLQAKEMAGVWSQTLCRAEQDVISQTVKQKISFGQLVAKYVQDINAAFYIWTCCNFACSHFLNVISLSIY